MKIDFSFRLPVLNVLDITWLFMGCDEVMQFIVLEDLGYRVTAFRGLEMPRCMTVLIRYCLIQVLCLRRGLCVITVGNNYTEHNNTPYFSI